MKKFSLKLITENALKTLKRFPLMILFGLIGTVISICFIEKEIKYNSPEFETFTKLILIFILSIPLLFSIYLIKFRSNLKLVNQIILNLLVIGILFSYYILQQTTGSGYLRYSFYFIASILLVTFIAYIKINIERSFWQFNIKLLMRITTSLFFSTALYAGLSLAILALVKLFNINLNHKIYGELFAGIYGIFCLWFFLAGVPGSPEDIDNSTDYPKIIKMFSLNILIPLAILYLAILYAYEIKLLFQWTLPRGWVSNLIIWYAVHGILSLLLIYPMKDEEGKKWVALFYKYFFILLFPLIILLFLAITKRISDYGITEQRYLLIVTDIWLTFIAIYFTFSKLKKIKIIPISLFIILILVSFGPWGAFKVSENSQINRFIRILRNNKILVNQEIIRPLKISGKDIDDLKSIYHYLDNNHKINGLIKTLQTNSTYKLPAPIDSINQDKLLNSLMIDSSLRIGTVFGKTTSSVTLSEHMKSAINISGWDYLYELSSGYFDEPFEIKKFNARDLNFEVKIPKSRNKISLKINSSNEEITIDFKDLINNLFSKDETYLNENDFLKTYENNKVKIQLIFTNIYRSHQEEAVFDISNFNLILLLKIK